MGLNTSNLSPLNKSQTFLAFEQKPNFNFYSKANWLLSSAANMNKISQENLPFLLQNSHSNEKKLTYVINQKKTHLETTGKPLTNTLYQQ